MGQHPSPGVGFRQARLHASLVLVIWVVSAAAQLPSLLVLDQGLCATAAGLPADSGAMAPGDLELISREAALLLVRPLAVLSLYGLLLWWLWTPLWHGGVVSRQIWMASPKVRLGELLGLGLAAWWKYLRLSLVTAGALVPALALVWVPYLLAVGHAGRAARWPLPVLIVVVLVSFALLVLARSAALWGAWLLGLPASTSAARCWLTGLGRSLRSPLTSVGTITLWLLLVLVISSLPLLLGWWLWPLRSGLPGLLVFLLADLGRCWCAVGLFCSFAPVTGVGDESTVEECIDRR